MIVAAQETRKTSFEANLAPSSQAGNGAGL
jgi:hypothetical protein